MHIEVKKQVLEPRAFGVRFVKSGRMRFLSKIFLTALSEGERGNQTLLPPGVVSPPGWEMGLVPDYVDTTYSMKEKDETRRMLIKE